MLAKVLVFAVVVATVSCENRLYRLKTVVHHEAPKEYRHHPQEHIREIPIREYQEAPGSEEQYKLPEGHGQAYSSQSIVHQGQSAAYEESQETNTEHVAPVYQYVDEQNEEQNIHREAPIKHKYHAVHYPAPAPVQHEIQTIQVPHQNVPHHNVPHYQLQSHEVPENIPQHAPHHNVPHYQPQSHEVPQNIPQHAPHHNVPHYQPQSHEVLSYHHEVPQNIPQHAPHQEVPQHHVSESHESHDEPIDYYAYPKYQYEYKVEDPHTGDNKFQHETRDGDVVKGVYGLHEADGSIRTVEYSSDKHHGFSAIVKHSAPGQHVQIETHHKN